MATAPCSTDVFEHLDDAAREEAYRSAVSEAAALKTEVDQLRRELELLKMVPSKDHDAANDDDAPKPPLDPQLQASHDFLCNLLAPLIERIERLESRTREDSDAASCTSAGESYASINMKRGSINQQSQAKGTNTRCMSNDEDARDRLSSFAPSSLPHLGKDLNAWFHQVDYWFRTFSVPDEVAVPFIISRLPAKDFIWMRHHTKVADISTWADMKAAFRRRYNMDCDIRPSPSRCTRRRVPQASKPHLRLSRRPKASAAGGGHSSQRPPDVSAPMNASGEQDNPALNSPDLPGLQTCGDLPVSTDVGNVGVSPKKARTDMHEEDSDARNRDPPEDHSEMEADDRPFTTVTYKKARPTGIPIILKLTDPDASFWNVNPNKLASEVVIEAKEKVQSFRVNRDGNFSVSVSTVAASSRVVELTRVAGLEVTPYVPIVCEEPRED
ncbi:hypothetical protein HPB50_024371 [Hyalomma asiaticum]|uniref:Uncharacterized protein n=1 Tax=Hyalomma asiaticum TaxID=266040 RepID=A0ACB7TNC3_HYAAI|nr:hypothetical protein HPB50_024371 [Hyalomma asiaticum]